MNKIGCFTRQKVWFALGLCIFLSALPAYSQNRPALREDLWVSPTAESNLYSVSNVAFGGGAALGYGDGSALGLRVIYCSDLDKIKSLEISLLIRFYLPSLAGHSGFFIQFGGGPVLVAPASKTITAPDEFGMISVGLSLGWRFLLGKYFFLEPVVRGGYPFIGGLGLSAGVHY